MLKQGMSLAAFNQRLKKYLEKQRIVKDLMKELINTDYSNTYSYLSVEKLAHNFVEEIINTAKKTVLDYQSQQDTTQCSDSATTLQTYDDHQSSEIAFVEVFGSFSEWPKIDEFTIGMGADRITDYLATWRYNEDWLYDMDMVLAESDACSDFYIYEVKWSIPTPQYPIPQATASVFFTIEVSRVLPTECYVNVTYQYEGCGYIHEPFKHSFQEQWLFNIIQSKLKFFQTLTF